MAGFLSTLPAASVGYFAARAAVALALGAVIGLERQWRQRTAGLRTNALVALVLTAHLALRPVARRIGRLRPPRTARSRPPTSSAP